MRSVSKSPKRFIFYAIIVGVIGITLFYSLYSTPYWYRNIVWRDIDISNLKIDNSDHTYGLNHGQISVDGVSRSAKFEINPFLILKNDKVIRLAMFYQNQKEDPLFVGNQVDQSEYKDSLSELERVNTKLKASLGFSESGLPLGFLKSTLDSQGIQEKFEESPTLYNAGSLIGAYKNTNQKYLEDVSRLKKLITDSKISANYFSENGAVTSKKIIMDDISSIVANNKKLSDDILQRENCLKFSSLFCERKIIKNQLTLKEIPQSNREKDAEVIKPEDYPSLKDTEKLKFYGPYSIHTSCFNNEYDNNRHLFYLVEDKDTDFVKNFPEFANNVYYQEITLENRGPYLYKQFKKKGIDWEGLRLNTPYSCNDLEYQTQISTLDGFVKKYDKPLITGEKQGEIFAQVVATEKAFYSLDIKDDLLLENMGIAYGNLYSKVINNENTIASEDQYFRGIKEELLDRLLIIREKQLGFPRILNYHKFLLEMHCETNGFKLRDPKSEDKTYDSYFYLMRTMYSLNFLNFSPSTLREGRLKYIDPSKSKIRSDIKNYKEAVEILGIDKVKKLNTSNRNRIVNDSIDTPIK
jgi:hypothetical protein